LEFGRMNFCDCKDKDIRAPVAEHIVGMSRMRFPSKKLHRQEVPQGKEKI